MHCFAPLGLCGYCSHQRKVMTYSLGSCSGPVYRFRCHFENAPLLLESLSSGFQQDQERRPVQGGRKEEDRDRERLNEIQQCFLDPETLHSFPSSWTYPPLLASPLRALFNHSIFWSFPLSPVQNCISQPWAATWIFPLLCILLLSLVEYSISYFSLPVKKQYVQKELTDGRLSFALRFQREKGLSWKEA